MKTPDLILIGDLHIQDRKPEAWNTYENWWKHQRKVHDFINNLCDKRYCTTPVLQAGDVFDRPRPVPHVLTEALQTLPLKTICVPGQHDLPNHNHGLYDKSALCTVDRACSSIAVLHKARNKVHFQTRVGFKTVQGCGYGIEPTENENDNICLMHRMAWHREKPYPGAPDEGNALQILDKYKQFELIVTGDNHKSFCVEKDGRWLINPGVAIQRNADEIDYQPRIFLYYFDKEPESVYLPVAEEGSMNREHIDRKQNKDKRLMAYIEQMNKKCEIDIDFEANLKQYLEINNVRNSVEHKVWEYTENEQS